MDEPKGNDLPLLKQNYLAVDVEQTEEAISNQASLSESDFYIWALANSHDELSSETEINKQLIVALKEKNLEALISCIRNGADCNIKYGTHLIPLLHLATAIGFSDGVYELLNNGVDVNATDSRGATPLHVAACVGDDNLVRKYVAAGAIVDAEDNVKENGSGRETPLHKAALGGHLAALIQLLSAGAKDQLEFYHVKYYHDQNIQRIRDVRGRTPLHFAAEKGAPDCIQAFLQQGVDVNATDHFGTTALLLLGRSFVLKVRGPTSGYTESIPILIKGGADVNVCDPETKVTSLHHAATLGRIKPIKALLKAGAKITAQDHEGTTPLHISALKGHASAVKLMINAASGPDDINVIDAQNRTALHRAAYRGSAECIQMLMDAGADLGAETKSGVSATTMILQLPTGSKILSQRFDAAITTNSVDSSEYACRLKFVYSPLLPKNKSRQMGIIVDILDESRNIMVAELFQHPLVESFLHLKWRKTRFIFFIKIFLYFVLVSCFTAFVFDLMKEDREPNANYLLDNKLQLILSIVVLIVIAQELFQCAALQIKYFQEAESWLKCFALATTTAVIFAPSKEPWVLHLSAFAILLGWTEVTLLMGRLPMFGVYPLMFHAVAEQLAKFIGVFIFLLAGFAFSFVVIFNKTQAFQNPWTAILRTVAMLIGDMFFDGFFYEEVDGEKPISLVGTAHVIYFLFLLFVALVLMNLLIGLAVDDIQGLQKEGRIKRLRKQAQFIVYLENIATSRIVRIVLGSRFSNKLKKWIDQDATVTIHPAARKYKVRLSKRIIEGALDVVANDKRPVSQVTMAQVYDSVLENCTSIENLEQKIYNLERRLLGDESKRNQEFDSDQESDDLTTAQMIPCQSLQSDVTEIKAMLTILMQKKRL